jgi:hypothetical protein
MTKSRAYAVELMAFLVLLSTPVSTWPSAAATVERPAAPDAATAALWRQRWGFYLDMLDRPYVPTFVSNGPAPKLQTVLSWQVPGETMVFRVLRDGTPDASAPQLLRWDPSSNSIATPVEGSTVVGHQTFQSDGTSVSLVEADPAVSKMQVRTVSRMMPGGAVQSVTEIDWGNGWSEQGRSTMVPVDAINATPPPEFTLEEARRIVARREAQAARAKPETMPTAPVQVRQASAPQAQPPGTGPRPVDAAAAAAKAAREAEQIAERDRRWDEEEEEARLAKEAWEAQWEEGDEEIAALRERASAENAQREAELDDSLRRLQATADASVAMQAEARRRAQQAEVDRTQALADARYRQEAENARQATERQVEIARQAEARRAAEQARRDEADRQAALTIARSSSADGSPAIAPSAPRRVVSEPGEAVMGFTGATCAKARAAAQNWVGTRGTYQVKSETTTSNGDCLVQIRNWTSSGNASFQ